MRTPRVVRLTREIVMPQPPKRLDASAGASAWFGAELRHWRTQAGMTQSQLGQRVHVSGDLIGKIEKAERRCTPALAEQLDEALSTGGVLARALRLVAADADKPRTHADITLGASDSGAAGWRLGGDPSPNPETSVDRRAFLSASIGWSTLLATGPEPVAALPAGVRLTALADAVTSYTNNGTPVDLSALEQRVTAAKHAYQACQYTAAVEALVPLLTDVRAAVAAAGEHERCQAQGIVAAAYQVAAGVLLKFGDTSIAAMAADRSMTAAATSGDPVVIGSSARAVTHTLMRSGHQRHAARLAAAEAERLDTTVSAAALSVQGALLLRGCVAAAEAHDRNTTTSLLAAATDTAQQLAESDNVALTGFNPVNIQLHQVHTALVLGDAGHAIDYARGIDIDRISLVERRATLAIDVAGAYTQWGRYEKALGALHLANTTAPEETRARPGVRSLLDTIHRAGPPSLRPHVKEFAACLT